MAEVPNTRLSLLCRLRDAADREAWTQFLHVYGPLIHAYARRQQLQDADAADVTQEVLQAVSSSVGRFDPERGSFRSWLFTLAHHKTCDFLSRRARPGLGSGDSAMQEQLQAIAAPEGEDFWNQEYERQLFGWAVDQVRSSFTEVTWSAFWQTAVEGKSAQDASASLGISVGAVYIAKSRVQARLKEQLDGLA